MDTKPIDDSEGAKALAEAQKPDPQHDYQQPVELPPHAPNFEKPEVAADLPPTVEDLPADEVTDFSEAGSGSADPESVTADGYSTSEEVK